MSGQRAAVVTGSSSGIGLAVVRKLVRADYMVFGLDVTEGEVPDGAQFIKADVSEEKEVHAAFSRISETTSTLAAVVNNAGIQVNAKLIDTTVDQWDRVMAVNLRSVFLVTKAAYPALLKSSASAVVNVGSVHAVGTSSGIAAYAASKGAIASLTRAVALELAPEGIRVNCVMPGAVDTPMLRDGFKRGHLAESDVQSQMAELAARTPMGRIGSPEEIARTVLFLVSSESSSFITGQILIVDGGALARLSTE